MGIKGGIFLVSFCVFNLIYGLREGEVFICILLYFIRFLFGKNIELNEDKYL